MGRYLELAKAAIAASKGAEAADQRYDQDDGRRVAVAPGDWVAAGGASQTLTGAQKRDPFRVGGTCGGEAEELYWRDLSEERAAVAEPDGGLEAEAAQRRAYACAVSRWLNENPPPAAGPDRCAHCGGAFGGRGLPFLSGAGGHVWLHGACHAPWMARRQAEAAAALAARGRRHPGGGEV